MKAFSPCPSCLRVSWDPVYTASGERPITGYHVIYRDASGKMLTKLLDPRKSTAHLKNLKKYTTYTVTVSAVTDEGLGDISEPVNVTTLEDGTFTMLRAPSLKQFFLIFFISFLKLSPGQLKFKGPLNDFDFFPDIRSV